VLIVPANSDEGLQVRPVPLDTLVLRAAPGASRPHALEENANGAFESAPIAIAEDSPAGSHLFGANADPTEEQQASVRAPKPNTPAEESIPIKAQVRGYEIEQELGRGGMGVVYLARQLSLDRPVALKVMSKRWATDPVFVARFTREAYAAAQLSHPNIVQIHDIGEVDGTRFFSMEYVRGKSLADVARHQGKLEPETAVGYVLQAARGLKHAHERGMIHRDVKPDNLLLDDQGLVKVADLGLVKTPTTQRADDRFPGVQSGPRSGLHTLPHDMTGAKIALGTPAYMSPEQCRDAATVDHRADIYSLGCTLYVLVTGRPPFEGTTAVELMTKHAYDPIVPPEQIAGRVPKELSAIIQRMMAKNADARFQSMGEVIRTLEAWLGVFHTGTYSPQEEQIARLEGIVHEFNTASAVVLRRRLLIGFFATLALTAVLIAFFGKLVWAFGLIGLAMQSTAAYFVFDGLSRRGHLFRRTRQFLCGLSWGDWIVGTASLVLFCVLLAMLKVFWVWTGFGLIGVGLAFALRYGLDRRVELQRQGPITATERTIRRLRMQGLDEEEIRQFIAKFAGRDWEEFFETLFGYEAKMTARALLLRGGSAGVREKHAAWREPLIAMMDRIEKLRREARERRLLQAVEQAQLLAVGAAPQAAEDQAKAKADAMVKAAGEAREAEERRARIGPATQQATAPVNVRQAVVTAEEQQFAFIPTPRDPVGKFVEFFVGAHVRAVVAAVLLAGCALWVYQNGLLPGNEFRSQATQAIEKNDLSALHQAATANLSKATKQLEIAGVPPKVTSWIDGWNTGFAGILLLASLFYRGNIMAVFVLLGASVAAIGHQHGILTVEPFRPEHVSLMLGSVLALVGFRLAR
jgi:hypothetical protein